MTGIAQEHCTVDEESLAVSARNITLPHFFSWVQKGGFAVLDQGLFAGSNFVLNILLARWLEPAQYGAFAVAYSGFLLRGAIDAVHQTGLYLQKKGVLPGLTW